MTKTYERMSGSADPRRTWQCLVCGTTPQTDPNDRSLAHCRCDGRVWTLERRPGGLGGLVGDYVWRRGRNQATFAVLPHERDNEPDGDGGCSHCGAVTFHFDDCVCATRNADFAG